MSQRLPDFGLGSSNQVGSWYRRVNENLRAALFTPVGRVPAAHSSLSPFELVNASTRYGSAQTFSAVAHVVIFCSLVFSLSASRNQPPFLKPGTIQNLGHSLLSYTPPTESKLGTASLGSRGGGGAEEPAPARTGLLPPASSRPLVPPRLVHTDHVELPAPPAVFDPNAPANVQLITNLGLPWMTKDTNSAGPGKGHGIGNSDGDGVGDDNGNGAGYDDNAGNYANVISPAACLYCPDPPYTDEARKAKLQGLVTLRVLVDTDGRAKRIRILKGLGLGLDENAVEAIRKWRLTPAHDARRQPIPSWVTIETRFQLI